MFFSGRSKTTGIRHKKYFIINMFTWKKARASSYIIPLSLLGSNEKESIEKVDESKENVKPVHEESDYPEQPKDTEEKTRKENETKLNEDKAKNKTEKTDKEKKTIVQIKEPINSNQVQLGSQILSSEKFMQSRDK